MPCTVSFELNIHFIRGCLLTLNRNNFAERNFHVGKYLELEFEFRTSELNGVLLSVSEPVGFPALSIELHNGKVKNEIYKAGLP